MRYLGSALQRVRNLADLVNVVTARSNLGLSLPLALASGGTGQTTAQAAREALDRGVLTLTDAANIATNCAGNNVFRVTLTATRILDNPTNMQDGATYVWQVKQNGTGGWNLTYGSKFDWGDAGVPTLSSGANKITILTGQYSSQEDKIFMTTAKGYN